MSIDSTGRVDPVSIRLVEGSAAPRWDSAEGLTLEEMIITEKGMQSGFPLVDFVFRAPDGQTMVFTTSGRIVQSMAAAVDGVNLRNHGRKS